MFGAPLDMSPDAHAEPAAKARPAVRGGGGRVDGVGRTGVPRRGGFVTPSATITDGTLVMTSTPGAKLHVDGVERGVTPATVALKPGAHQLEARRRRPRLMPITMAAGAQVSRYYRAAEDRVDLRLCCRCGPSRGFGAKVVHHKYGARHLAAHRPRSDAR
jgi:hypothetical protein